jgi:urease accessory protein
MTNAFEKPVSPAVPTQIDARDAAENSSALKTRHEAEFLAEPGSQPLLAENEKESARARSVLVAGAWPVETTADLITLDYEGRHRRRFRYVADGGTEFVLDLAQTTLLHDGDGLRLDDGRIVAVRAAPESLVAVTAADADALLRLAWHIGNRHLPAQLSSTRILIRNDAVIVAMLRGLGATVVEVTAPFTPERGAYAHAHEVPVHPFVFKLGAEHGY